MKQDITIRELAKLMQVSVHQIRYFEEKGVLQPAYTAANQYRMYSMEQVYELAHILLLRKLEVPVQSIKASMAHSADEHRELLNRSLQSIEQEMIRLRELQQFICKMITEEQSFSTQSDPYLIKTLDATCLRRIIKLNAQQQLTAAQLAEQVGGGLPDLFERDIHYLVEGENAVTLCLETEAACDVVLQAGEYLTQQIVVEEDELDSSISQFYAYAQEQAIPIREPLVILEKSYLSLFAPGKLHYELRVLLQPAALLKGEKSE